MYEDIKNVCLYVRYSSSNQTEQSIEGQTRVCREFCERHGFRIADIYTQTGLPLPARILRSVPLFSR